MIGNVASDLLLVKVGPDTLDDVCNLYQIAFPEDERRPLEQWLHMVDNEPTFQVLAVMKEKSFAGFITYWTFHDFIYVEHFAVDPNKRGNGIGGAVLELFLRLHTDPIVLEVEIPETVQAQKRIRFYEKHRFVRWLDSYLQPPYRKGGPWLPMNIMSYGGPVGEKALTFEKVREILYERVYKVKI